MLLVCLFCLRMRRKSFSAVSDGAKGMDCRRVDHHDTGIRKKSMSSTSAARTHEAMQCGASVQQQHANASPIQDTQQVRGQTSVSLRARPKSLAVTSWHPVPASPPSCSGLRANSTYLGSSALLCSAVLGAVQLAPAAPSSSPLSHDPVQSSTGQHPNIQHPIHINPPAAGPTCRDFPCCCCH